MRSALRARSVSAEHARPIHAVARVIVRQIRFALLRRVSAPLLSAVVLTVQAVKRDLTALMASALPIRAKGLDAHALRTVIASPITNARKVPAFCALQVSATSQPVAPSLDAILARSVTRLRANANLRMQQARVRHAPRMQIAEKGDGVAYL